MTENANAAMPSDPLNSDLLARALSMVVSAMQTDYAAQFRQYYPGAEDIRQLKRRLYAKLRGIPEKAIFDGYERCTEAKPNFMPSAPEIIAATLSALKDAKRVEKNREEAAMLPPPKDGSMPPNIRALRDEVFSKSSKTDEEYIQLVASHEALIVNNYTTGIIRHLWPATKPCACCNTPGGISNSTKGDGNYYCDRHWQPS
jgi:hypothetical protein